MRVLDGRASLADLEPPAESLEIGPREGKASGIGGLHRVSNFLTMSLG